jgi:CRP/FNR family transcriptional regulator, cyclic AMP receptor protein
MGKKYSQEEIIKSLSKVDLFKDFSENKDALAKIAQVCKHRSVRKGIPIIKEGEKGDELFILIEGDVEIINKTLQDEEYTVVTLKGETGGRVFGDLALLDSDKRSATVKTVTNCELLVISRNDFMRFGNENPELGLKITRLIAQKLSERLRKSNKDIITLFSALVDEVADEHLK